MTLSIMRTGHCRREYGAWSECRVCSCKRCTTARSIEVCVTTLHPSPSCTVTGQTTLKSKERRGAERRQENIQEPGKRVGRARTARNFVSFFFLLLQGGRSVLHSADRSCRSIHSPALRRVLPADFFRSKLPSFLPSSPHEEETRSRSVNPRLSSYQIDRQTDRERKNDMQGQLGACVRDKSTAHDGLFSLCLTHKGKR